MTIGVRQLKTGLNKVMGRNLIALVSKTCGHRQADSGRIKPGSETVNNPDPDSFRPQNQRSRTQNPKQTRPQPPVERGWADKADSRPPLRGPGGWAGDWYVWHAPDGPRARAVTGLGCVQAGAEKLGVMEASYASAIIGVLSPVSSHCVFSAVNAAVGRPHSFVISYDMTTINTRTIGSALTLHRHFHLSPLDPLARNRGGSAEGATYFVVQRKCMWPISPKRFWAGAPLGGGGVLLCCRTRFEGKDTGAP